MKAVWWIIIAVVVGVTIYKIVRGFIVTSYCKRILKRQREKLKEEGLITDESEFDEGDAEGR